MTIPESGTPSPCPLPAGERKSDVSIRSLLSAAAVRERAHEMLGLALENHVEGWRVDLARLADAADLTAAVTRENYPDLNIPFHARSRPSWSRGFPR